MAIPLTHDALWTSYDDVRRLVYQTVHAFIQRHGGEFGELLSEAQECFVKAHGSYNPRRAKYTTWIRNAVWWGLLEHQRQWGLRHERFPQLDGEKTDWAAPLPFAEFEFLDELSADAQTMARLVLEERPANVQQGQQWLLNFLHDLHWSAERIAESFLEIRETL
jgi:DNA-directed RNA polymerase specialized sigma24 family protein